MVSGGIVNGQYVKLNHVLQNKDRVELLIDDLRFRVDDEEKIAEIIASNQDLIYDKEKIKSFHT